MSRASGFAAIVLAVALSWTAVSCSGPVLFKPSMVAATTQDLPATTQAVAVDPGPQPWHGAAIFGLFTLALLLTIGASSLVFRSKPPQQY